MVKKTMDVNKTVSIADVAKRAEVSIATVSRVINGVTKKASEATILRVQEAIKALGYRPSGAGRALRQGKSHFVALLASNLANPTMAAIAAAAEIALRQAGYVMILCDTHDDPKLQDQYLREMKAHYASGFILLGAVKSPVLKSFIAHKEPLIFVNRKSPWGDKVRHVGVDNQKAGAEVAHWFIETHKTPIALIHGNLTSSATSARVDGFLSALAAKEIKLLSGNILGKNDLDHLKLGASCAKQWLDKRTPNNLPRAIFCTGDLIAYGAHRAFLDAGIANTCIVGFDDSPMNEWIAPWLSAVRVPYEEYGKAIVQSLASESDEEILLAHQLIIR